MAIFKSVGYFIFHMLEEFCFLVFLPCNLSTELVPSFADRGCRVASATDLHDRIFGFFDRKTLPLMI
jgi:hypothetical protein